MKFLNVWHYISENHNFPEMSLEKCQLRSEIYMIDDIFDKFNEDIMIENNVLGENVA